MKLFGIACFLFGVVAAALAAELSQDDVCVDLRSGEITFNGVAIDADQLRTRARGAASIMFKAGDYSRPGRVEDLFAPVSKTPETPRYVPLGRLTSALEALAAAEVDPKMVLVSACYQRGGSAVVSDKLVIVAGDAVVLNGAPVELAELSARLKGTRVSIVFRGTGELVGYPFLLDVTRALGNVEVAELSIIDPMQVRISAAIHTLGKNGAKDTLSAPRVTTMAGNEAIIRVVENGAGAARPRNDYYHQEDLANLGVRFKVEPRIIGEHIVVDGVAIITRSLGKEEAFCDGDIPVYSYSVAKTVVPFSKDLPPGARTVEFDVAEIDGRSAKCELTAELVDSRGLAKARAAAH